MEILSGVKYVFITDVLQLMLRTVWSFSVYVHCPSFSIHLGNFIKPKKSYNRYLAFDPLFALVWCRRLSNDTKWAKRDFAPNNQGENGLLFNVFYYYRKINMHLCETIFCLFMESVSDSKILYFYQSHPGILCTDQREIFIYLCILWQNLVPTGPIMQHNLYKYSVS